MPTAASTFAAFAAFAALAALIAPCAAAERINHEGRILGPAPTVLAPVLFDTAQADAVVAAMQVFPRDNPWNEDVSRLPTLANTDAMIARITADLASSRRTLRVFFEMNYVLVPDAQPAVPIAFFGYPDESEPSPYPIPANLPIEGWPHETGALTLQQWQQDVNTDGGDRHAIVVEPTSGRIWETWQTKLASGAWQASNGAEFDLGSDALRPAGWTSADAAGLAMFPALVRYDECQRGMVEHAVRLIVKRTRLGAIYPARHDASVGGLTDADIPAMGQRLRLKGSYAIPAGWSQAERAVALALKKHGALVADNGGFFSISACPDDRWAAGEFDHLSTIPISAFEVVRSTGPTEGPRSPGAPTADAGPDQSVTLAAGAALAGVAGGSGITATWSVYPGAPGAVLFADPHAAATTAGFSAPGTYTLLLKVDDLVHTPAFDAVVITVASSAPNLPPTVQTPAAASPGTVAGTTTALSTSGSDDGPEANLTYTWSATGPAPVAFSPNGTNPAKHAVATFSAVGSYQLIVTIRDADGATATSTVAVTVQQTLVAIVVSPSSATVAPSGSVAFAAGGRDQFAHAMPAGAAWGASGGGTIGADGVFAAGATIGGPYIVTASSGAIAGTAQVTIAAGGGGSSTAPAHGGGGGCGLGSGTALGLILALSFARRR